MEFASDPTAAVSQGKLEEKDLIFQGLGVKGCGET